MKCCRCGENPGAARESIYSNVITLPIYCLFILCWTINTCSAPTPVIGEVSSVLFSDNLSGKVAVAGVLCGSRPGGGSAGPGNQPLSSPFSSAYKPTVCPAVATTSTSGHGTFWKMWHSWQLTVHTQFTPVKTTGLKFWWGGIWCEPFCLIRPKFSDKSWAKLQSIDLWQLGLATVDC